MNLLVYKSLQLANWSERRAATEVPIMRGHRLNVPSRPPTDERAVPADSSVDDCCDRLPNRLQSRQAVARLAVIGFEPERLLVMLNGATDVAGLLGGDPQIVVRLGIVWPDL